MFSFTLDIYCTSVRPGRGIPHMWLSLRFLLSFYLLKGFFSSFSLLLLRVKGRGCHTLLKPNETNCDWWILAIQIKCDWLIDWLHYITDNNSSIHFLSIMLETVYYNQCCKYSHFADVLSYTGHLLHFSLSWERDPSHVSLSLWFLCFFLLLNFCSIVFPYSCWGLRAEDEAHCLALLDTLWFVNMSYTNTIWLIDWKEYDKCIQTTRATKISVPLQEKHYRN